MIYNGTCLDGGAPMNGGDCNAMRSGSFGMDNGARDIKNLADCVAKVKQCKYGNYATFNPPGGPFACGWSENCPTLGTPEFCVDCSKPKQPNGQPSVQCAAMQGHCPSFIQFYTEVVKIGPGPHPPLPNFTCSTPPPSPGPGPPPLPPTPPAPPPPASGTPWEPIGPWNIGDDKDNKGEAGTLSAAASPKANPNIIYTGGHNNGVSSGILKSVDGGSHWTKNSSGIWDTHILGVFIHPSDPTGNHVLVGTGTGIYETKDGAASWQLANETEGFGAVVSFAETTIGGKQYISASHGNSISSVPVSGGLWQTAAAPGSTIAQLSTVTTAGKTEVVMCTNGHVRYGAFDTPTHIEWTDPLNYTVNHFVSWSPPTQYVHQEYPDFWDSCPPHNGSPKDCKGHWHWVPCKNDSLPAGGPRCPPDGSFSGFPNEGIDGCRNAVINGTDLGFIPAALMQKGRLPAPYSNYSMHCFASDNFATWTTPVGASQWANGTAKDDIGSSYCGRGIGAFPVNKTKLTCMNAAVDPNDRNHFLYSEPTTNYVWDSHDGGASVRKLAFTGDNSNGTGNHNHGTFYVAIDGRGWSYSGSMGGAFVSRDNGTSFDALHMVMTPRRNAENATEWPLINRVNHDYQGISTMFRGDGIAFPSDQGLGIVDGYNNTLINAVGDLHNNMAMSALISPSKDGKSRNIVTNLWDWNQAFSIDDGATWRGWGTSEAAPYTCGEGGWGFAMGKSGYVNMFHHADWWHSSDGGYNFVQNTFPGSGGLGLAYVRQAGSLTEPNGTVFSLMKGPAGPSGEFLVDGSKSKAEREHEEHVQEKLKLADPNYVPVTDPSMYSWLLTSENFGLNFTYKVLPDKLQTCGPLAALAVDPTMPNSLYFLSVNCLAHSTDYGMNWSSCITAPGLEGSFMQDNTAMIVKNSKIMFLVRSGMVPLKTVDGGATWKPMTSLASFYPTPNNANFHLELSWTGKTLVHYGSDRTAILRRERASSVWKSTDDGETWTDETGDLVTSSIGHGRWYESDFYLVTQGQGVIAKRNFE